MRQTVFFALLLTAVLFRTAEAAEICGNGLDDDADGLADEGCYNLSTGVCESPLSCNDTGMISPVMGSLRYQLPPDVAPKVPYGSGIGMRRFYTSQYAPAGGAPAWHKPMGERWQHTYSTWITKTGTPPTGHLILHTNRGQDVRAAYVGTSPDGAWHSYTPQCSDFRSETDLLVSDSSAQVMKAMDTVWPWSRLIASRSMSTSLKAMASTDRVGPDCSTQAWYRPVHVVCASIACGADEQKCQVVDESIGPDSPYYQYDLGASGLGVNGPGVHLSEAAIQTSSCKCQCAGIKIGPEPTCCGGV